jgi:hypothetical protein
MVVELTKQKSGPKKFKAVFLDDKTKKKVKTVYFGQFGARGYEDSFDPGIHIVTNDYII